MPVYKNSRFLNSGGNGINHIQAPGGYDLIIEDCEVDGSQGHGVNVEPAPIDVAQQLGLPGDIDRAALADALRRLALEPSEEKRKSLLDPEGGIMRSLNIGEAAASLGDKLLAISANPNVHMYIDGLIRMIGGK